MQNFRKIAKIRCREICDSPNREINMSWKFHVIRYLTYFLSLCLSFVSTFQRIETDLLINSSGFFIEIFSFISRGASYLFNCKQRLVHLLSYQKKINLFPWGKPSLNLNLSLVVFLKAQFSAHYYFLYMSMILQTALKFKIFIYLQMMPIYFIDTKIFKSLNPK